MEAVTTGVFLALDQDQSPPPCPNVPTFLDDTVRIWEAGYCVGGRDSRAQGFPLLEGSLSRRTLGRGVASVPAVFLVSFAITFLRV